MPMQINTRISESAGHHSGRAVVGTARAGEAASGLVADRALAGACSLGSAPMAAGGGWGEKNNAGDQTMGKTVPLRIDYTRHRVYLHMGNRLTARVGSVGVM